MVSHGKLSKCGDEFSDDEQEEAGKEGTRILPHGSG